MKCIHAKLGNMRNEVEWVVYPQRADGLLRIQSDHRICSINPQTRIGRLSPHCANYPCFATLLLSGAQDIVVSPEVVNAALDAMPQKGDRIGGGVFVG